MTIRKDRALKRAEHSDPINYTCGICRRVHRFDKANPYICEDAVVEEPVVEEPVI